jgi:hypothetical protein
MIMPNVTLSDPNGYPQMICGTGCNSSPGGCNTPSQIEAFFLSSFPNSALRFHKIQYGCWTGTQSVSVGGNCCPPIPVVPGGVSASQTICAGMTPAAFVSTAAATGGSGTITYSWQSSTTSTNSGFSNISAANNLTFAPGALFTTTYYRRAASTSTNNISYSNVITVTVYPVPLLTISGGVGVCPGGTLVLTANGASTYTWLPMNVNTQQITVNSGGTGTFTLMAMSANGCSASAVKQVSLHPQPTVTVNGPQQVCQNAVATMTASGANFYLWQPGSNSGPALTVTPSVSSIYSVTGTDFNNCSATAIFMLNVSPLPTISIAPSKTMNCAGDPALLIASGAQNYTWTPGNAASPSLALTPTVSASYTVNAKDQNGCPGKTSFSLVVTPKPVITISLATQPVCSGKPASLVGLGGNSYTWQPGLVVGTNYTMAPLASSVYTVTGEDANCTNTAVISVSVVQGPSITLSSVRLKICSGEATRLNAAGAVTYTWLTAAGPVQGASVSVSPSVTSSFSVSGTGTNTCEGIAAITVTVSDCIGLRENSGEAPVLEIYPNPNQGEFRLRSRVNLDAEIINAAGEIIRSISLNERNENAITVYGLTEGVYFLKSPANTFPARKIIVHK